MRKLRLRDAVTCLGSQLISSHVRTESRAGRPEPWLFPRHYAVALKRKMVAT